MKSHKTQPQGSDAYSPKEYWTGLAGNFDSADPAGFAPVLHPDAPPWFNELIDRLQYRAIRRALALADIPRGGSVLDVGCGTGRWVRRYRDVGFHVTGMDATPAMLSLARDRGTGAPLAAGEAHRLPFLDEAFDFVSDVTVIQHIPRPLQPEVLGEMIRVLKPGGRLLLVELIRGEGVHIFPRSPEDWIELAASHGVRLLDWFGQEYLLLDRLFVHVTQLATGGYRKRASVGAVSQKAASGRSSTVRRIYWGLRHVTVPLSAWTDPIAEVICPGHFATHAVFVFQK